MNTPDQWLNDNMQVFWGEIAPTDHLVQIYDNDEVILNSLEGFAGSGFLAGDSVVIIATSGRIEALNQRLEKQGLDIVKLKASDQYIPLDAEKALETFMVNGWPDEIKFLDQIRGVLHRSRNGTSRKVRAYGEMVALLWAQGKSGATVQLEHLWNKFCSDETLCLFCAYPRAGFTRSGAESIKHICDTHTKIIDGSGRPSTEIFYKNIFK